jgi:hypothetical protein
MIVRMLASIPIRISAYVFSIADIRGCISKQIKNKGLDSERSSLSPEITFRLFD